MQKKRLKASLCSSLPTLSCISQMKGKGLEIFRNITARRRKRGGPGTSGTARVGTSKGKVDGENVVKVDKDSNKIA